MYTILSGGLLLAAFLSKADTVKFVGLLIASGVYAIAAVLHGLIYEDQ